MQELCRADTTGGKNVCARPRAAHISPGIRDADLAHVLHEGSAASALKYLDHEIGI